MMFMKTAVYTLPCYVQLYPYLAKVSLLIRQRDMIFKSSNIDKHACNKHGKYHVTQSFLLNECSLGFLSSVINQAKPGD